MTAPRLLVLTVLCLPAAAGGEDWPRFRGPNGTGTAARAVPLKWSPAENVVWKKPLDGGHSSPIIAGGKLLIETCSRDGRRRSLLCLNAADGEELWRLKLTGKSHSRHRKNSMASSTPAAGGGRAAAVFWDGANLKLLGCDLNGKNVWRRDLGPFSGQHGAGVSPIIHGGKIYLANDQDGSAAVLAFDAATGKPLWSRRRKSFRASYATPFIRRGDSGEELVVASTAGVAAYGPATGEVKWQWAWPWPDESRALRMVGSPAAAAGLVFAYTGNGGGRRNFVAVEPGGGAKAAWSAKRFVPYVPSLLTAGDLLFAVDDRGTAACYEAKTGKRVWAERLAGPVTASPIIADGKVIVIDEAGTAVAFAASREFKILAKSRLGELTYATPAAADGRLFVRTAGRLYCFGNEN